MKLKDTAVESEKRNKTGTCPPLILNVWKVLVVSIHEY